MKERFINLVYPNHAIIKPTDLSLSLSFSLSLLLQQKNASQIASQRETSPILSSSPVSLCDHEQTSPDLSILVFSAGRSSILVAGLE